jgi:hypothetical protein
MDIDAVAIELVEDVVNEDSFVEMETDLVTTTMEGDADSGYDQSIDDQLENKPFVAFHTDISSVFGYSDLNVIQKEILHSLAKRSEKGSVQVVKQMFNDHAINIYQAYLLTVVDDFLRKWLLQDVGILNKTPTSRLMLLTVLENIEDIQLAARPNVTLEQFDEVWFIYKMYEQVIERIVFSQQDITEQLEKRLQDAYTQFFELELLILTPYYLYNTKNSKEPVSCKTVFDRFIQGARGWDQ